MRRLQGGHHRDFAETRRRIFLAILATSVLATAATSLWALDSPLEGNAASTEGATTPESVRDSATEPVLPELLLDEAEIRAQDAEEAPTTEAAEETTEAAEEDEGGGDDGGSGGGDSGGGGSAHADAEAAVFDLVNDRRAENGCGALERDSRLDTAALLHAEDMAANDYFSHESQDGRSPTDRANAQGYDGGVGENIAAGYPDAESVMQGWMDSEGHRANILNCDYDDIGVGAADRNGTIYWVQAFG
ncbi:CAP domain-containing protein [Glycomyces harbinensis]|uniref:Cysteine-rich secretory protein family protein n=1 Tax=Glycomyces harbinensis TaxID=58114 RepID=A0A1G6U100_9ACTN|nr:CAP domain-containing protein [Glycomyces harbinensis]SDD34297.1 Cysteine-rich secretory protein family protein [Glycomyces harbinensis]